MPKVTKRIVDALKPGQIAWDSELRGFGARHREGRISYLVKYRTEEGRQRWFTLGAHGPLTPDAARDIAKDVLEAARKGEDPSDKRKASRKAMTVAELYATYRDEVMAMNKPRTRDEYERLARLHILPHFGKASVTGITQTDVKAWHGGSSFKSRRVAANRAAALFSHMMTFAEDRGLRPVGSNPARGIKKHREQVRQRFLTADEMARLGAALEKFEGMGLAPMPAINLFRVLLFTGMRLSEGLNLCWRDVNLGGSFLHLPESKTGEKIVPLPAPARDLLAALPRASDGGLVFPGKGGAAFQGIQKIWQRIRKEAKLDDVRIHDLRHSFASVAVQAGTSLYVTGAILGHAQASTTQRYAHLDLNPVLAAAERTAATIAANMTGAPSAPVLPFTRHRR